ncbi:AAA family ATPase [Arthrobacter sp. GCM10027362]|uniref:AAA family ATPase n=1 Tax=Arthrobacter sp. GCM10027362 TaxID=3273379 RepID=UPI003631E2C7
MAKFASARRITLNARKNALTREQETAYHAARGQMVRAAEPHNTLQGELSDAMLEQIDDWILTSLETGQPLPAMGPADYEAAIDQAEINAHLRQLRNRETAQRLARKEREGRHELPGPEPLDILLEDPDEDAVYRIQNVFPTGAHMMLAAQAKAGKTQMIGNVIRSLVDGAPFLGKYPVQPVEQGIVLIDNELDPRMLRRWLRAHNIRNTHLVEVVALRGRTAAFDILDPAVRAEWVRKLEGADLMILDCLRPSLDALGLSEDKEAGRFISAWKAFTTECQSEESIIVHHMGHSGERARGDSGLIGGVDGTWKIVMEDPEDPTSSRYFSAYGRDVEVTESQLGFDPQTRHLTIAGGSRKEARADYKMDAVLDFLANSPGTSKTGIKQAIPGDDKATAKALDKAVELGLVEVKPRIGRGGGFTYSLTQVNSGEPRSTGVPNSGNPGYIPGFLFGSSVTQTPDTTPPGLQRCRDHPATPRPDFCDACKQSAGQLQPLEFPAPKEQTA